MGTDPIKEQRDELLAAAKLVLRIAEDWTRNELHDSRYFDNAMAVLQPCRDAIAKAEAYDKEASGADADRT